MLKAQTIRNEHADLCTFLHGDLTACASACRRPEETCNESLVFVSQPAQLTEAARRKAAIIIVHEKLAPLVDAPTREWLIAATAPLA